MRVLCAQLNPTVADLKGNTQKILHALEEAQKSAANLVVFPELALCGYPPEDFLLLPHFVDAVERCLQDILPATADLTVVLGTIRRNEAAGAKPLFNTAAVMQDGKLLGFQDKRLLPTYDVFDEWRYFEPAKAHRVWNANGLRFGVTVCEDMWQHGGMLKPYAYPVDPVRAFEDQNLNLMINVSSSPYHVGKWRERINVCTQVSHTLSCPVLLCNQVGGNDSLLFDGHSLYVDADHQVHVLGKGFEEDLVVVDLQDPPPAADFSIEEPEELYRALLMGLRDYFEKQGFRTACLGLSGGIDSALVAVLAAEALGSENVLAVAMPSRYSSDHSLSDAEELARHLGIELWTLPIEKPFQAYLDLLGPYFSGRAEDVTEENIQARIRGMLLMALSNKFGHIVLSTGNKSELAMGYSTLYGDMCGGLSVINDLTKTQVFKMARWLNREKEVIPWNTIEKPPSAELRPDQKDSDSLPDYDIVDKVLEDYIEMHLPPEAIAAKHHFDQDLVDDLVRRIHRNEYKRRQGSPGLRVTERAFSVGRRFPIVQGWV